MTDAPTIMLVERMVIEPSAEGPPLRIVAVDRVRGWIWLMRVDAIGWPAARKLEDVEREVSDESYVARSAASAPRPRAGELSAFADRKRWQSIEPLVRDPNRLLAILEPRSRGHLVNERVKEIRESDPASKISRQQISRLLKRYFARGMTPAAVATDYARCGARGKPRELGDKKVGRPRTHSSGTGVNATTLVRQRMLLGTSLVLRRRGDLGDGYAEMIEAYYTDTDGKVDPDRPTFAQFAYFYRTRYPDAQRRRARIGSHRFELTQRPLLGRAGEDAEGPGSVFTIDSTTADMFLVSEFDRSRLVGRPTLYLVSDDFSHVINGMYASFEPPSWEGAMMALINVVEDKVAFCARYGVVISPEEWPCHHLPRALAADRGEMASKHADGVANRLICPMRTAAPGRGDMKAICERDFGSVQRSFGEYLPGYVARDFGTRDQEADYRRKATFTLSEYYAIIIYSILEHNALPVTRRTAMPEMVSLRLTSSPLDFWNYGLAARTGRLRSFTPEEVALEVMRRDHATVTPHGIHFARGYYLSQTAHALGWYEKARHQGHWKLEIAYDPRCMDSLYLCHRDVPSGFERIELNQALSATHCGKSLSEINDFYRTAKLVENAGADDRLASTLKRRKAVKALASEAAEKTARAQKDGPSAPQRIKAMAGNRQEERAIMRQQEALTSSTPEFRQPSATSASAILGPNPIPTIAAASPGREARQERLDREQRERRALRRSLVAAASPKQEDLQ